MNLLIEKKTFIDCFEVRDYLAENGYNFNDCIDNHYFGYLIENNKVIAFEEGKPADYPVAQKGKTNFISYTRKTVGSWDELVSFVGNGETSYDTYVLSNNLTQTSVCSISSTKPLEIDLNGKNIFAQEKTYSLWSERWCLFQALDLSNKLQLYIHDGTLNVSAHEDNYGIQDDASCLSIASLNTCRVDKINLNSAYDTQCVSDFTHLVPDMNNKTKKVYISNCVMKARRRAMAIAGGTWEINNCTINGMINIDGGKILIEDSTVDASERYVSESGVKALTTEELAASQISPTNPMLVGEFLKNNVGGCVSNDAIFVTSRRVNSSIYDPVELTIKTTSLSPVVYEGNPLGYGLRYWDVKAYTDKDSVNPILSNITYLNEKGGFGGYSSY